MPDYGPILKLIEDLQQQVEAIKDELGRLQAEEEMAATPPAPRVIPPTAPELEIMGGAETDEFPDCCAVGNHQGYFCSGTLIAPNVVVTARHCLNPRLVFIGGNDITTPGEGETIRVRRHFSHPEVDLMVLLLEHPAKVSPRHVAQGAEVAGDTATLVGFGTIDQNGMIGYGRKRKVEVPIVTLDGNGPGEKEEYGCVPGREMVAGHRGLLMDSCSGDSGGPLYIRNPEGQYYLLGATSRGIENSARVCGDGGVYVRVDLCLDWIRKVTGAAL